MSKRRRKIRPFVAFLLILFVSFLFFIVIKIAVMDTTLSVLVDFTLPKSTFTGINYGTNYGQWAVAVNGSVIAKSAENLPNHPTASTAKMILALAVMKERPFDLGELGETITITDEMYDRYVWYINNNGSNTAVVRGEEISEYDALASILMASSNNMADSLAIWAFGSIDQYKNYASRMLKEMGLTHTVIGEDASGYSESTTSTADELAVLGTKVLAQPVLAQIVGMREYEVPVAGVIHNSNKLLGELGIVGVKTGYIGDSSGYCLVSGYTIEQSNVVVALLGAPTREQSFDDSKTLINELQSQLISQMVIPDNVAIGFYDSWWTGLIPITTTEGKKDIVYEELNPYLEMDEYEGKLIVSSHNSYYEVPVKTEEFQIEPSLWQKLLHVFGWKAE